MLGWGRGRGRTSSRDVHGSNEETIQKADDTHAQLFLCQCSSASIPAILHVGRVAFPSPESTTTARTQEGSFLMAQVRCIGSCWAWQSWVLARLVEILFMQSSLAHTVWIPAVVANTVVLRWRKDKQACPSLEIIPSLRTKSDKY